MRRKKLFILALALSGAMGLYAQLTLRINAIPVNTPDGAILYAAGTFNNWNPSDATKKLTPLGGGQYQIVLNPPAGQVKFKFTRGSWATVEGNANGGFLPDRVINYTGQPATHNLSILSWEDLGGTAGGGTATPNVQILDEDFFIPELNRHRRVWIYLPPDYQTSSKKYPVLYMQDGQNLFDASESFSGEWEIDESLNSLHTGGDWGCIVVGIDNGGQYRLDEYSPWINPSYGGGQGDEYTDFIVNTLKPYVDNHYRTIPGRNTTAIGGSSMGALVSMFALSERQDMFSKAIIFSPAFWFGGSQSANHVAAHVKQGNVRVYFMSGSDEEDDGNQSNEVVDDMLAVAGAMNTAGFGPGEKNVVIKSDGQHSEWFWAREFPAAYQWIFSDFVSATKEAAKTPALGIFPNPADSWFKCSGAKASDRIDLQIVGSDGKVWRNTQIRGNDTIQIAELPTGFYYVKLRKKGTPWSLQRLVKS